MPNTPVQAAGEAMPKTTRRAFLAGAAVSAMPSVAVAAPIINAGLSGSATSPLAGLIAAFDKAAIEAESAGEQEDAFYDMPDRPEWPKIKGKEFSAHHIPLRCQDFFIRDDIVQVFAKEDERINRWLEFFSIDGEGNQVSPSASNFAERDNRLSRNAEERDKLLSLYDARKAVYEDWSIRSGHAAAKQRAADLDDLRDGFEDQVISYAVSTFDEVKLKAAFIHRTYGGETRAVLSANLVKEISEIGRASA